MAPSQSPRAACEPTRRVPTRKSLGAWATPAELVDTVVERAITVDWLATRPGVVRVLDPACGDGRFLRAASRRIRALGGRAELVGVDIDPAAIARLADDPELATAERCCADALAHDWGHRSFDLVLGNPPFLSQLSAHTSRGGSSRHGGGPYADAAAEFLGLSVTLADADGGRVGLVLPQSILAARDAGGVRAAVERSARMCWSWWSPERHFDADVLVCALGFERAGPAGGAPRAGPAPTWSHVVVDHLGIPPMPEVLTAGTLGDRADLNANFRDEYYGLVPAVSDRAPGPPLVTTGLIDPGRCTWGHRPVRFAKQTFAAPRVDLDRLDARMRRWADRKLVPKVLVASQTAVVEAVVDASGTWLPGVPVTSAVARGRTSPWEIGAVLTSPVATLAVWHRTAGTGLSARAVRIGPTSIATVPWPAGDLSVAVAALREGDVDRCGIEVTRAYGVDTVHPGVSWWRERVSRATGAPPPSPREHSPDPTRVSR